MGVITTEPASRHAIATPSFQLVLLALVVLTIIRLIGLHYSTVDLFFDEAQYWAWSRELAFGYFSKPPLLAWIIAASDPVCGSGEACVRAAAPLFYLGTCLLVYAIANELYDRQIAAWSALAFAMAEALSFSTRIISTDVPLIFFWAAALLAYVKLLPAPDWRWSLVLGVALGLGTLAKYAMAYFLLCAILAAFLDRDARALLLRRQTWIALLIAALIVSPNVYWNFTNGFVTLRHTGDNITGDGLRFVPMDAAAFFASQFAVAGPFVFATFLIILFRIWNSQFNRANRLMLAFAIPPLVLVIALSFVRVANANWAAASILSMTILVVAWWLKNDHWRWLWATLVLGLVSQAVLIVADAHAYRITVPALGSQADLYRRTLGWRGLGNQAGQIARKAGAATVVAEGRAEAAALIYYLRHEPLKTLSWPSSDIPQNHFELTRALDNSAAEPVLLITYCPFVARLKRNYQDVTLIDSLVVSAGPNTRRHYQAFRLASRTRDIEPLGPCVPDAAT